MKNVCCRLILLAIMLLMNQALFSQGDTPQPDESMDIFLLSMLLIFTGMLIGALLFLIALCFILLIGFLSLFTAGILSASLAIGFYHRSVTAGFKAFIRIFSVMVSALAGLGAAVAATHIFEPPFSMYYTMGIGTLAGALGGILVAQVILHMIKIAAQKLKQLI